MPMPTTNYVYGDTLGLPTHRVTRKKPKGFFIEHWDGASWRPGKGPKRPDLYHVQDLFNATPGSRVYLCEGEKDVETLRAQGLLATTNSGGAHAWDERYNDSLKNLAVVLLEDNDDSGRTRTREVGGSLFSRVASLKLLRFDEYHEHADVTDWFAVGGSRDELEAQASCAPEYVPEQAWWRQPTPLTPQDVPTFPVNALPPWLRGFVTEAATSIQVPVCMMALLTLGVLAAAAAKRFFVRIRTGYVEPLNLYTAAIMDSGDRKSAAFRLATAPLVEFESVMQRAMRPEVAALEQERATLKAAVERVQKAASHEQDPDKHSAHLENLRRLAAKLEAFDVPALPRELVDDCTPEGLGRVLSQQNGSIALMSPEGGVFEMMAGRYSAQGTSNLDLYLKAYSGDTYTVDRAKGDLYRIERPRLTIAITCQPDVLHSLGRRPEFRNRGLISRFVYVVPKSLVGARNVNPPPISPAVDAEYRRRLHEILRRTSEPVELEFSAEAESAWLAFMAEVEQRRGPYGDLASIGDWARKIDGLLGRLAGLLHVAHYGQDADKHPVEQHSVDAAGKIVRCLTDHAITALGEMEVSVSVQRARVILRWILKRRADEFSRREIQQSLKGGACKKGDDLDDGLSVLEAHEYIREKEVATRGPGRPAVVYVVNPKALVPPSQNSQNTNAASQSKRSGNSGTVKASPGRPGKTRKSPTGSKIPKTPPPMRAASPPPSSQVAQPDAAPQDEGPKQQAPAGPSSPNTRFDDPPGDHLTPEMELIEKMMRQAARQRGQRKVDWRTAPPPAGRCKTN